MTTLRQETARKLELVERYRALRREQLLGALRAEARAEEARGRYPWRGAFRTREEILELYRLRRYWDRRFLADLLLLVLFCAALIGGGGRLVRVFFPHSSALPPAREQPR